VGSKHHEGLKDCGLLAASSRAKNGPIGGDFPPPEHPESQVVCNGSEDPLIGLKLNGVIGFEKYIANSILSGIRKDTAKIPLSLPLEEAMGNSSHNPSTVTISTVSSRCTSMGHGAEKRTSIGHNLMTSFTLDLADESYTTRVLFVLVGI
jgi:hypothetical protein